jgi:hypothetical protein
MAVKKSKAAICRSLGFDCLVGEVGVVKIYDGYEGLSDPCLDQGVPRLYISNDN